MAFFIPDYNLPRPECPCKRDCPDRTGTCKLTCAAFAEYEKARLERNAEKDKAVRKHYAATGFSSARKRLFMAYQNIDKNK